MKIHKTVGRALLGAGFLSASLAVAGPAPVTAQWSRAYEQFYLPAKHNWQFRQNYISADRLFNAFDYGHSVLYEELYTRPGAPVARLEEKEFDFLTKKLLRNPPRVPLEEGAIEVEYVKLAPEAKEMFHWAHILHRQAYDIWADDRLSPEQKDRAMANLLAYYKSRRGVAFSSLPKSMELMDGQYYSLAFREKYPKFNGLIWAYHWLQVGLYEPLLVGRTSTERKSLVDATVARFFQMIDDAPKGMPHLMPMTAAVAPEFSKRYPEVAIIFDNLHMMHDVISDILASPEVPRGKKRAEILRAARLFADDTSYVTSVEEWWEMARMMGLNNMGGPAVGFLAALPEPTVPRGMSMAGMEHSQMDHGQHGATPTHHGHAGHGAHAEVQHGAVQEGDGEHLRTMHEIHLRMMQDPAIRERVMADTTMHRQMMEMMQHMPVEQRQHMMEAMHPETEAKAAHPHTPGEPAAKKAAPRKAAPAKPAPRKADPHAGHGAKSAPAAKPVDPHAGHKPPPAKKPAARPDSTHNRAGRHPGGHH